jgi:putative membrane protein insertion efficiency factor
LPDPLSGRRGLVQALFLGLILLQSVAALAGDLRGPETLDPPLSRSGDLETSPLKLGMQGVLRLYQKGVSPVNPDRCGFRPSCSAYGVLAVHDHGPFFGLLLTADRLMRCHPLKQPGPFSPLLPGGKILDLPPARPLPESP